MSKSSEDVAFRPGDGVRWLGSSYMPATGDGGVDVFCLFPILKCCEFEKNQSLECSKLVQFFFSKMFSQLLTLLLDVYTAVPFNDFPSIRRFWDSEITALYVFLMFQNVVSWTIMMFWDLWIFAKRYHFWNTLKSFLVFLALPNVVLLKISCFLGVSKCCDIKMLDHSFFWCARNFAFFGFLKTCIPENTLFVKNQAHAMSSETPPVKGAKRQQICWEGCTPMKK